MFSGLFGTMPLGFLLTNLVLWLVPPLRRANAFAAGDVPGMSFRDATHDLALVAIVLGPICAVASLIGVWDPWQ